jgi:two-component system C4-dicarboxylate transport sensor histidine kinase DctB
MLVAVAVALSLIALPRLERAFLIQAGQNDEATLRLATEVLRGALGRTEALPALLAERPILTELLYEPDNSGLLPFANEQLRQTALRLDVSDVYLMDLTGLTLAASSYRTDRSFIGENFAYRPYFTDALNDGIGRFHALGTTSGQRGYYFAAPVIDNTRVLGVVAIKLSLERFEQAWNDSASTLIVTDSNNVIFMSDREDWRYRTLGPLSELALEGIAATRQYPLTLLQPLPARRDALDGELDLLSVDGGESFVMQTALIAAPGWRVSILTPTGPARAQALTVLTLMILTIMLGGLIGAIFVQRRAQLMERLTGQKSEQERLERRVRERTLDLNEANRQLLQEVDDRRAAEQRLRKTQADLVQAGKLAALGQMSAALSHEFNQPLAAVKSYAENAAAFLDRDRPGDARENITRISAMADRMASISKHLRNFARRPQDKAGPIPLMAVIADAVALMQPRMKAMGATLAFDHPATDITVTGGRVRLQQVIVNLIANALDAMAGQPAPRIDITVSQGVQTATVHVRDHGPGFSESALAQAFDPFFTTKDPGQGLGLGLSISYNIVHDFGGTLAALNHPEGGAEFAVTLHIAVPQGLAAE